MKPVERAAYVIGILLILSGLVHVAVLLATGGSWSGPLSLRKPATFGLSFGLTLINLTVIASLMSLSHRMRTALIGVFAAACVVETFLVSMQAWRGVPSHFNMETRFDAAVAVTLAIGGFTLVVVVVALAVSAIRHPPRLPAAFRSAIQAGLLALVGAQIAGAIMIATGVRLVVGGNPALAYATGGWLKPVHGLLMHGILVLPMLGWLVSNLRWTERAQTRAMTAAIVAYTLVTTGAAIDAVITAAATPR